MATKRRLVLFLFFLLVLANAKSYDHGCAKKERPPMGNDGTVDHARRSNGLPPFSPFVSIRRRPPTRQDILRPIRAGFYEYRTQSKGLSWGLSSFVIRHTFRSFESRNSAIQLPESLDLVATPPRGGSQVRTKSRSKSKSSSKEKGKKKKSHHDSALSAAKPFFPLTDIGKLTLTDVGKAFEYAVYSSKEGFDKRQFLTEMKPLVQSLLQAMDKAVTISRGPIVKPPPNTANQESISSGPGNIDVFNFCAAARVLSEWRIVRQVPEGFKRYAVSMKLGHKDVVQNIGKIEAAAHDWIDYQKEKQAAGAAAEVHSPTIRELLQYEIDMNLHPALPTLKEISGGMGILWVRRQLQFQSAVFENLLHIPKKFATSSEAFSAAYNDGLNKFHGWTLQKIFRVSLKESPEIHEVYKVMNPRRLKEVIESANKVDPEEREKQETGFGRIGFPKTLSSIRPQMESSREQEPEEAPSDIQPSDAFEQRISLEMEKDAHKHIKSFLEVIHPILDDLDDLFDELNMNDPKKV